MVINGSKIFRSASLLPNRINTLWDVIAACIRGLVAADPDISEADLVQHLIDLNRLTPLSISHPDWNEDAFQQVHRGVPGQTETFYAFSREVTYTGSQLVWRQLPYRGFSTELRVKFSADGGAFLTGYCSDAERQTIDRWLKNKLDQLDPVITTVNGLVEEHNDRLERIARQSPGELGILIATSRREAKR